MEVDDSDDVEHDATGRAMEILDEIGAASNIFAGDMTCTECEWVPPDDAKRLLDHYEHKPRAKPEPRAMGGEFFESKSETED